MLKHDWSEKTGEDADVIKSIPKYVFSSTIERADWNNSTVIGDDVPAAVVALKKQAGRDLVIWGHGLLGQTLLAQNLLDEIRISLFPIVVGRGKLLFRENESVTLKLVEASPLPTGAVVLRYQRAKVS